MNQHLLSTLTLTFTPLAINYKLPSQLRSEIQMQMLKFIM